MVFFHRFHFELFYEETLTDPPSPQALCCNPPFLSFAIRREREVAEELSTENSSSDAREMIFSYPFVFSPIYPPGGAALRRERFPIEDCCKFCYVRQRPQTAMGSFFFLLSLLLPLGCLLVYVPGS
ncbi:hypothetical protein CEXT_147471 [Caerostris extrusa]|uniref:Transmembrane protein n=1 Tax=Caerostris extrusa TaxID=172846 RepID=A0AAV4M7I9_CAEEX|nr:hypothetical protein CEXT_147471 [Caerostris extrusa]